VRINIILSMHTAALGRRMYFGSGSKQEKVVDGDNAVLPPELNISLQQSASACVACAQYWCGYWLPGS
jgi:hypothetical protein